MLGNIKDDEIQRRLDELRRDTTNNNNDDDDNINFNFDDGDNNDDDMETDDFCVNITISEGDQYQSQDLKNMKMSYSEDMIG